MLPEINNRFAIPSPSIVSFFKAIDGKLLRPAFLHYAFIVKCTLHKIHKQLGKACYFSSCTTGNCYVPVAWRSDQNKTQYFANIVNIPNTVNGTLFTITFWDVLFVPDWESNVKHLPSASFSVSKRRALQNSLPLWYMCLIFLPFRTAFLQAL